MYQTSGRRALRGFGGDELTFLGRPAVPGQEISRRLAIRGGKSFRSRTYFRHIKLRRPLSCAAKAFRDLRFPGRDVEEETFRKPSHADRFEEGRQQRP